VCRSPARLASNPIESIGSFGVYRPLRTQLADGSGGDLATPKVTRIDKGGDAGCGSLSVSPRQKAATVIDQQRRTKTSVIQLCDRMAAEAMRNSIGNWKGFGSCR
jgi:hypothetical protein